MKRRILLFLTISVLLLGTACGAPSRESEQQPKQQSEHSQTGLFGHKADSFKETIDRGNYYLECDAYVEGTKKQLNLAVQGKNCNTEIKWQGFSWRTLNRDGKSYVINKNKKAYAVSSAEGWMDVAENGLVDTSMMKLIKKGRASIDGLKGVDGRKYEFEAYKRGAGNMVLKTTYYFKGDELYAITSKVSNFSITMVVTKLTDKIPKGAMELPKGYEEVKEADIF